MAYYNEITGKEALLREIVAIGRAHMIELQMVPLDTVTYQELSNFKQTFILECSQVMDDDTAASLQEKYQYEGI